MLPGDDLNVCGLTKLEFEVFMCYATTREKSIFLRGIRKGLRLGVAGFVVAFILGFGIGIQYAHADTTAEQIFGRWERVTPETMTRHVPDWMPTGTPGSVTNEYRKKGRAAQPHGPNSSPYGDSRPSAPEQVAGLTNLPERR